MNHTHQKAVMLYQDEKLSCAEIARRLGCTESAVNYWIKKAGVIRTRREACLAAWEKGKWSREQSAANCRKAGKSCKGKPCKWKGQKLPQEWRDKISAGLTGKRVGAAHHWWKGGATQDYGPGWNNARRKVRRRAGNCCEDCGVTREEAGEQLHVHHKTPFRSFATPEEAHQLDNLILLCRRCHYRWEHG